SATGGTPPYSYSWNFGDCSAPSSTQNPLHVYNAGNWYAILTVTDSALATDDAVVAISAVPIGFTISGQFGRGVAESGETDTFSIALQSQPSDTVTLQLDTSDDTEARISTDGVTQQTSLTLTFTTSNWSTPQIITIHGRDDALIDGDIAFQIITQPADSTDASYDNLNPGDIFGTNYDDDVAGVTVTPLAVEVVETGTTDDFTVVLDAQPAGDVVIDVASNDTGEAMVSPAQLTFNGGDWSSPKSVTVTGVDDALSDGDQQTTITLTMNTGLTTDSNFDAVNPADVTATTIDDETLSILSTNPIANENSAPRSTNIAATATASVNAATVTQSTFRVQGNHTGRVAGSYSATGATFELNPTNDLKPGELIHVTATSGIQTPGAIAMTPHVWQFLAATGPATAALAQHASFSVGGSLKVTLGDIDADGDLDAIFANTSDVPESVWKNDGNGTFTQHATFGTGDTYDVALGDLDGDGDLDAFAGNRLSDDEVWLNNGTGTFTLHDSVSSDWTMDVTLGDLDGDGDLDAVLANQGGGHTVWLNDGTGDFSAHPTTPTVGSGNVNAVALGDLDGDGDLDAIQAQQNGAERVWVNDGSGAFTAHATAFFGGDNSWDVALGDLDNDGDLDAVVANQLTQPETVWLNDGSGVFTSHGSFGAHDSRAVVLGDMDGDGDLDAIVGNAGTNETVWLNDGTGAFTAPPSVPSV
ncbi:MAG: FG-GAP-like repeat-containing protein, partial [Thermoanaerobaculia bacterium]